MLSLCIDDNIFLLGCASNPAKGFNASLVIGGIGYAPANKHDVFFRIF